jgi:hypothetical protein
MTGLAFFGGNTMQKAKLIPIRNMELKYCERCGHLWLRRCGAPAAICPPCAEAEEILLSGRSGSFLSLWTRLRAEVGA